MQIQTRKVLRNLRPELGWRECMSNELCAVFAKICRPDTWRYQSSRRSKERFLRYNQHLSSALVVFYGAYVSPEIGESSHQPAICP